MGTRLQRRVRFGLQVAIGVLIVFAAGTFGAFAGWIDTKTGQPVANLPIVYGPGTYPFGHSHIVLSNLGDRNRAYDPETGRNFARNACGDWIDTKTGKRVSSLPIVFGPGKYPFGHSHIVLSNAGDRNRAYDPETGRNFARESCPKSKTAVTSPPPPPPTPRVGMVVEPHIGVGIGSSSGTSGYNSTGGQLPFDGDWSQTSGQICGGATFWPGFVVGPARVGLDINVCSGSNTFGGDDTTLFQINRHGPGGDVELRASTDALIDMLAKVEIPIRGHVLSIGYPAGNPLLVNFGIGLSLRDQKLALTSDQSFFGGGIPSVDESQWQAGLGLSAGVSTFLCPDCLGGNPLKVGVEGRFRFFPSESIRLTSPAFGFTETGSTGRTTDISGMVTLSSPLTIF